MQLLSIEAEPSQVLVNDPKNPGKKLITKQASGYVTIKTRVMSEYCLDSEGNHLDTPKDVGDEWEAVTITVYRRKRMKETDPNAN